MSGAWQFYFATLLVYTGVNLIAVWALNLQYGVAGILNFAFVIFQAIGAYTAAVVTLGPSSANGGYETYILGSRLPWPLPIVLAGAAGGLLAFVIGLFALRPRRSDYQALVLLTVSIIATVLVTDQTGWLNGPNGLVGVPRPLGSQLNLGLVDFGWFYAGLTMVFVGVVYFVVHRLTESPWGRQVRAMREHPVAVQALGVNIDRRRMQAFVCGGVIAAVSGALLVQFVGAWSPTSWTTGETFAYVVALVVGGLGSNRGAAVGAILILTVVLNGLQFAPFFSLSTVASAMQFVVLGLVIMAFVWLKPRGLFPERRHTFGYRPADSASLVAGVDGDVGVD